MIRRRKAWRYLAYSAYTTLDMQCLHALILDYAGITWMELLPSRAFNCARRDDHINKPGTLRFMPAEIVNHHSAKAMVNCAQHQVFCIANAKSIDRAMHTVNATLFTSASTHVLLARLTPQARKVPGRYLFALIVAFRMVVPIFAALASVVGRYHHHIHASCSPDAKISGL